MISQISTVFRRASRFHKQNLWLKLFQESITEMHVNQYKKPQILASCSLSNLLDNEILTVDSSHVLRRILYEPGQVNGAVGRVLQKSVVLWVREISFFPCSL